MGDVRRDCGTFPGSLHLYFRLLDLDVYSLYMPLPMKTLFCHGVANTGRAKRKSAFGHAQNVLTYTILRIRKFRSTGARLFKVSLA